MSQIRKINGIYYIEFYARGLLYSQPGGNSLQEAQKLLAQVEEKIAGGEALTIVRHIELQDFFQRFMDDAKLRASGPKTLKRFADLISHFHAFLGQHYPKLQRLADLTPAVIESYKADLAKDQGPRTVNFSILLLRDILEFGIKIGFLNDNPTIHMRLLTWPKKSKHKPTARHALAKQLITQGTGLFKMAQLLKLSDIAKTLYYANLIPLTRVETHENPNTI